MYVRAGEAPVDPVWPAVKAKTFGTAAVAVDAAAFRFTVADGKAPVPTLEKAFRRYQALTFPHAAAANDTTAAALTGLSVAVADLSELPPQLETDESYELDISDVGGVAKLTARTVYGALRGLETFSQLVEFSFSAQAYAVRRAPWAIKDAPRFPHRGLMVDTARHFETLAGLRAIIDSLPYAKLNMLHWHMVDIQSFPFESKSHPLLWEGAYSDVERYTQADIAEIVEYVCDFVVIISIQFCAPHPSSAVILAPNRRYMVCAGTPGSAACA